MKRDEQNPSPWTNDGKQKIKDLNLKMIRVKDKMREDDNYIFSRVGNKLVWSGEYFSNGLSVHCCSRVYNGEVSRVGDESMF